jgi:uroporphyrinogen decarboxylase
VGKDNLYRAFKREEISKIPWVPFVGVHGGYLIDTPADEYLKSSEKIFEGISKAIELYKPDGIPVVFDLQIEAEIFGCELKWSEDYPPSVVSHPLSEGKKLNDLKIPDEGDGRIPIVMEALNKLKERFSDVAFYGLVTGPLTLITHLMGPELFMKMVLEPENVIEAIKFATNVTEKMAEYYSKSEADVVAVVDPMVSQISPKTFEDFLFNSYVEIFSHIKSLEKFSSFFVCGDARKNIEIMAKTGPDNISVDENVPISLLRDTTKKYNISFGGNISLATVLLNGTPQLVQKVSSECIYESGFKGYILSPGCDLPYATPVENLRAVLEVLNVPLEKIGEYIAKKAEEVHEVEIEPYIPPDYSSLNNVIVDVFTVDSSTCAACQYMVGAVKDVEISFNIVPFEWKEHKLSEKEALAMMKALNVKQLPSIVIDGEIVFESVVPNREQLLNAIKKAYENKKFVRRVE